jgi:hypothetical protein
MRPTHFHFFFIKLQQNLNTHSSIQTLQCKKVNDISAKHPLHHLRLHLDREAMRANKMTLGLFFFLHLVINIFQL